MKHKFDLLSNVVEQRLIEKIQKKKFTDGEYEVLKEILAILVGGKK